MVIQAVFWNSIHFVLPNTAFFREAAGRLSSLRKEAEWLFNGKHLREAYLDVPSPRGPFPLLPLSAGIPGPGEQLGSSHFPIPELPEGFMACC